MDNEHPQRDWIREKKKSKEEWKIKQNKIHETNNYFVECLAQKNDKWMTSVDKFKTLCLMTCMFSEQISLFVNVFKQN